MGEFKFAQKIAIDFEEIEQKKRRSAEERKASYERTKKRVADAIVKDGGRYVTFSGEIENDSEIGLLVCAVEFEKKLYFLIIDKDRKIQIVHHGESYRLLKEIPGCLSVLNYIYVHQRPEIRGAVEKFLEENGQYKLISEIAIRPQKRPYEKRGKKPFEKRNQASEN